MADWTGSSPYRIRATWTWDSRLFHILLDDMEDLDDYQSKIDYIADHTDLPILESKEVGLEGLKNILLDALDRNQHKCSVKKEQIR